MHDQSRKPGQASFNIHLPPNSTSCGIGLVEKIKAYGLQDEGLDTVEANHALGYKADSRDYGGFDLEVVDQVPIMPPMNQHNTRYLATKRDKMGHRLPEG